MLWCTCGKQRDGYSCLNNSDAWVCSNCRKPARLYFERYTAMAAPPGAKYLISIFGTRDGLNEVTYECENRIKKVVVDVAGAPGVVLKMWEKLDASMRVIMEPPGDPEKNAAKIRARAIAEIIADCMPKFFDSADAVAREAAARYQDLNRETPGLATDELHPRGPVLKQPITKLTPEQEAGIKNALVTGAFTSAQLADMFKVPIAAVEALQ